MSDPYNPGPLFPLRSDYGKRKHPITGEEGKFHSGQDFGARLGTPIPAATPGEVVYSGFNDQFGNTVIVKNSAGYSLYAHMQDGSPMPKPGQRVWPGDIVGNVGSTGRSTGPHLHYSVIKNDDTTKILQKPSSGGKLGLALTGDDNGQPGNTIDPREYDTSVPYIAPSGMVRASGATPFVSLNGLSTPDRGGALRGRFGAWASWPDSSVSAPASMAQRPGGLPGMIADYLRQNESRAAVSQPSGGGLVAPAVPFVSGTNPMSPLQSNTFNDRFGDWSQIRRLSSPLDSMLPR